MKPPDTPTNERERLRALDDYRIVDTPPEAGFDALTELAAELLDVPIALVSIIDADRQWFKSRYGLEAPETPRELSFCGHAVFADAHLVVPDAWDDERFADNPLVTGEPRVRFYAGSPLRTPEGFVLGTLCAIDHEARQFTPRQQQLLDHLAGQAMAQLELRRQHRLLRLEREVTKRHRKFFELSLELLCTADDTLHFHELNPAWESTLGWSLDELRARPFTEFVHPDDLERTLAEANRLLLDSAVTVDFENRYRHRDGHWVTLSWVVATTQRTFFATARDISAHRRSETALLNSEARVRENEERLRSIIDTAVDAIITIDERGGIERVNPAVESLFGFAAEELAGRNVNLLMPPPDHERHDGYLAHYRSTGERRIIGVGREVTARRKDGSTFDAHLSVSEFEINGERRFTGIVRDISERKRVERLQAEFVSTVSHELRTPLTSIRGSLGLIVGSATGELPERTRGLIEIAHRNSERLSRLVDDILDIEKIEAGKMQFRFEPVDLALLARQSIAAHEALAEASRVRLVADFGESSQPVVGDDDRLTQVITNLLSNAIKFSPEEGIVRVVVSSSESRVRLSVADQGPGVPADFADRIFGRFQQADSTDTRKRGGTGLGLSIAKAIVERLGGAVGFESKPGEGSRFFFDLPAFEPVTAQDAEDSRSVS